MGAKNEGGQRMGMETDMCIRHVDGHSVWHGDGHSFKRGDGQGYMAWG